MAISIFFVVHQGLKSRGNETDRCLHSQEAITFYHPINKNKGTNAEQRSNQGKPVKPSAIYIVPSGSVDWLLFNDCFVPRPDSERFLRPMLMAPKRAYHMYSMTAFTQFRCLTITRFQENLPQTAY
jgi:hypothetical protein